MNWDQIESKWALMTRRIRADWGNEHPGGAGKSAGAIKSRGTITLTISETQTFAAKESEFKISAK